VIAGSQLLAHFHWRVDAQGLHESFDTFPITKRNISIRWQAIEIDADASLMEAKEKPVESIICRKATKSPGRMESGVNSQSGFVSRKTV
jgi:hypothetical protein